MRFKVTVVIVHVRNVVKQVSLLLIYCKERLAYVSLLVHSSILSPGLRWATHCCAVVEEKCTFFFLLMVHFSSLGDLLSLARLVVLLIELSASRIVGVF